MNYFMYVGVIYVYVKGYCGYDYLKFIFGIIKLCDD